MSQPSSYVKKRTSSYLWKTGKIFVLFQVNAHIFEMSYSWSENFLQWVCGERRTETRPEGKTKNKGARYNSVFQIFITEVYPYLGFVILVNFLCFIIFWCSGSWIFRKKLKWGKVEQVCHGVTWQKSIIAVTLSFLVVEMDEKYSCSPKLLGLISLLWRVMILGTQFLMVPITFLRTCARKTELRLIPCSLGSWHRILYL